MSQLRHYPWEVSYSTSDVRDDGSAVDLLHDFYMPVLARSSRYDRVAGYFSSSSLAAASRGFSQFAAHGGAARFIVGVELAAEDAEAIVRGDRERAQKHLDKHLDERLGSGHDWPADVARGVELLAWMVANDHLSVKVAIRIHGATGVSQALDYSGDGYVHEKWAVFDDDTEALVASGSLNESRTALILNAENLEIFTSWEGRGQERIARKRKSFELMWADRHPHIRVFELPEAIRQRLLKIAERVGPLIEVDGTGAPNTPNTDQALAPTPAERLQFAAIRLAPLLPGGEFVGMETTPIQPWPHQRFVARRLIESYPDNHLLCDEVGLGKTIEAGLVFRSLWLSGRVSSIRVFAPASLTSQWLHEMAEKFFLPFRRRFNRRGGYETVDPATGDVARDTSVFFDHPLEIISTGLLVHGHGARLLADMPTTDIVLLDEAHKARRREPDQTRREARFNKLYQAVEQYLFPRSRSLLLATATPMQLNRVEAFDLLRFMYASGAVRLSADLCNAFYSLREELVTSQAPAGYQIKFLARYLADAQRSAPAQWHLVRDYVLELFEQNDFDNLVDYGMAPTGWAGLQPALTMLSPLGRPMLRHTRELLRVYQREGLLNANLAQRHVEPVVVELSGTEHALYEELQAYCDDLARRVGTNRDGNRQRAAIGFYLSFLRLRFASSFQALAASFERRLDKIDKTLAHHAEHETWLGAEDDADDLTEEELTGLVLKNREPADLTWEQGAVQGLLDRLRAYQRTPRKTLDLLALIERRRDRASGRVRPLVIFTRYADTLRYLYDELTARLPDCPLATFSGAGGRLRVPGTGQAQSLARTKVRQQFVDGSIDILLCTDAAAEGLNLQSADLLVNFDLPWNPMLLEQRIGRIDRIGQAHERITVCNFVYQNSVEEVVYIRLVKRFQDAVSVTGALQFSLLPIEEKDFQDYAKTPGEAGKIDWDALLQRAEGHRQRMDERRRLTEFAAEQQKTAYERLEYEAAARPPPVTLDEIWQALRKSPTLRSLGCAVEAFEYGEALTLHRLPGIAEDCLLTTSRKLYEHGLPGGDERVLRFAAYGDSVFEAVLDYMLVDEEQIRQAWAARRPLAYLATESMRMDRFPDEEHRHAVHKGPVTVSQRAPEPTTTEERGESGRRHQALVASAAAALARTKLPDRPAPPARHMQRLDDFIANRPQPRFHLPVSLQNQSDFVACSDQLLWSVAHAGTRLSGDPILFEVCRDMIERAISALSSDRRTNEAIADHIERPRKTH